MRNEGTNPKTLNLFFSPSNIVLEFNNPTGQRRSSGFEHDSITSNVLLKLIMFIPMKKNNKKRNQNSSTSTYLSCHRVNCKKDNDDVALQQQMTFLLICTPSSLYRVRLAASSISSSVAFFHHGDPLPHHPVSNPSSPQGVLSPEAAWFVKVVCTLCVRESNFQHHCSEHFRQEFTQSIAFEVIRRLSYDSRNVKVATKFFEFSRVSLNLRHSFESYDLLIRWLCKMGLHDLSIKVFSWMRGDGHMPHGSGVTELLISLVEVGKVDAFWRLLAEIETNGKDLGVFVYNTLLRLLIRQNRVNEAVSLFEEHMDQHSRPDICSFNTIINGLCNQGDVHRALKFFKDMDAVGFPRDVVTYTTLLKGYFKSDQIQEASNLFHEMTKSGIKPNIITFNTLIDGYGKAGDMSSAMQMYDKMLHLGFQPDVFTLTPIIHGYCLAGQVDEGLKVWNEMHARNMPPSSHTFCVIIHALCKENRLQEACEFLRKLSSSNIIPLAFIYNPVIDGLCKAGNVDAANLIVTQMEEKRCKHDIRTFTILIIGHCMKGRMSEAISIFNKMLATDFTPDSITINSLVSHLLKAGMVNEAFQIKKVACRDLSMELSSSEKIRRSNTSINIPVAV